MEEEMILGGVVCCVWVQCERRAQVGVERASWRGSRLFFALSTIEQYLILVWCTPRLIKK